MKIDPCWLYLVPAITAAWMCFAILTNVFFGSVWLPNWVEEFIAFSIIPEVLLLKVLVGEV